MDNLVKVKIIPSPEGGVHSYFQIGTDSYSDCYSWMIPKYKLKEILDDQVSISRALTENLDELLSFNAAIEKQHTALKRRFKDSFPKIKQMKEDLTVAYKIISRLKRRMEL